MSRLVRATWAMPIIIAALSLLGLVSALVGDGLPDIVAWIALSAPVIAVGWAIRAKNNPERTNPAPRGATRRS